MKTDHTGRLRKTLLSLGAQKSNAVLDVGCGKGEYTFIIAQKAKSAVGIDPDEKLVRSALQGCKHKNILFQVGRGESLGFSSTSFDTVVFCQSLHHVPLKFQSKSLKEAWRVLKTAGKLLIIEPINRKGSLEEIECLYHDEKEARHGARNAIESLINDKFILGLQKEIRLEETCNGFEDLFQNNIQQKSYVKWDDSYKNEVVRILDKCEKTSIGEIIMEYFATVWLLYKKS
jgi:ubiquinone/menaquinone biosynthesis C-methylase UbiE